MAVTLDHVKHIHLIGIGGCSMSGIAEILRSQGHEITGSDRETSQFTQKLEAQGIHVSIGQKAEQAEGADLVIYSAAIKPDNPERQYAREHGIPEMERSVALGQLSARYPQVAAIAGCHGKTTITSMLAYISEECNLQATMHIGGFVDLLDGGVKIGGGELLITEACEYVKSFLTLSPTVALINNIDNDHLDCYRDIQEIEDTFVRFCSLVPEDGRLILCTDDVRVQEILPRLPERKKETYGLYEGDRHAANITYDELGCPSFDVVEKGKTVARIALHVPGTHNILNALGAYSVGACFGGEPEKMAAALGKFQNTKRRFEYMGERDGVKVFHDYGHHPHEIAATLEAASRMPHGALYCVFQCNSYTRARTLFCENVDCFALADRVLVPDIYPGREVDTGIVHARDMVKAINDVTKNALYLENFENIRTWLTENARPGDVVITVGSGNVYAQTQKLL